MRQLIKIIKKKIGKVLWNLLSEAGSTNFPTSLDSYTTKNSGDTILESHVNNLQDAVVATEIKIGTGSSTPASGKVLRASGTGTSAWAAVDLTTDVTGTLPTSNGGTSSTANANAASGVVLLDASSKLPAVDGSQLTNITTFTQRSSSGYDFSDTTLTIDGAFHDLDLSSIVPLGAKAVLLHIQLRHTAPAVGLYVAFRKNGETNAYDSMYCYPQVANLDIFFNIAVSCDTNRVIEYYVINTATWSVITVTVKGWWI